MSQPFNRSARIDMPGRLDERFGEFWVENPWDITEAGHNLSAFERNRTFLNVEGSVFFDVSYVSGADNDGDTRGVVAADFRNVGRQDLLIRQVGGGPLVLYENQIDGGHYLNVSLRGIKSNRRGIGARLTATVEGRSIVREMYPANTFRSQSLPIVHLGLGEALVVDSLLVQWPSGEEQWLTNLAADRHVVIEESRPAAGAIETVIPGETIRP